MPDKTILPALAIALLLIASGAFLVAGMHDPYNTRVVDGDTLDLDGRRIRLWGIDAPEMNTAAGERAKRYLQRLVKGQPVRCEGRSEDRYRRVVARCYIGKADIAEALVRAGHAQDAPKYSRGYYSNLQKGPK